MVYNPFTLKGKKVLVTGASSGIGQAIAIECSKLGAELVITGRNEERLMGTMSQLEISSNQMHKAVIADLLVTEDVERLINEADKIDGVVLCSGKGLTLPFQFASRKKFDDIFDTNFFSPVELLRLLYKKKQINKNASIVFLSSIGGTDVFSNGSCIYGASKAALNSIMKFCAKEFANKNIRVNSICPGMVDTPLIHRGTITEEQLLEDRKRYLLKRYGCPEEVAYGVVYLLSDASSWVTGTSIIIDGGFSVK